MQKVYSTLRGTLQWITLGLAALTAVLNPLAASAQTIITFDATATSSNTYPVAINLAGTVAGEFQDAGGLHGFLRAPDGTITTFDPSFCSIGSTAVISSSAINNPGAVIGFCGIPNVGFLRDPLGNFTKINPPGSTGTQANSINDSGEVAGSYVDSSNKTHGFVWDPVGGYTSFDVPGSTYGEDHFGVDIVSINNSGQVAGFYFVSSSVADGFLREPNNTFTTFPAPVAGDRVQATSMNDSAQITGFYGPGFTTFDGFLQQGSATTSFDVGGVTQTEPQSINRSGTIVGFGSTGFNNAIGFVRNPGGAITTFVVPTADNTQPQSVNDLGVIAGIWLGPAPSFARHGFKATFTTATAPDSGTSCNGTYNGTFAGNITVSAGQVCNFIGGGINGNVTSNGGTLGLSGGTVSGNVQISGGTFSIGPSAKIQGNLQISSLSPPSGQNQVCGTAVQGNLQFQNNGTAVQIGSASPACSGNTVLGNFEVHNNTGAVAIFDNTVKGNLQCQNNTSIIGGGNTATGNKQGQCAAF